MAGWQIIWESSHSSYYNPIEELNILADSSVHEVSTPRMATTMLVDLRNFTPNLNAAKEDDRGINVFCHFLSEFYAICLNVSLVALPADLRPKPPLYMSSTGDGILTLFLHPSHARHGFLASLLLRTVLELKCAEYNSRLEPLACPHTSFGIGVQSGPVSRIRAWAPGGSPIVDTYIGPCINVAARAEATSKMLYHANTIIAQTTNELLSTELFGQSYEALIEKTLDPTITDSERLATHDQMNELNRKLCLTFIHYHNLKGVDKPMALYRIADSIAQLGNPRFEALITKLTDNRQHLSEVSELLAQNMQAG